MILKNLYAHENIEDRWLKASIIGGTWGSFEIITGSFLHNLKIPFAGTIMAFFSVLLMTAFLQQWKQKGIIWRAGLIAALMKSLSPSAFLLGPMTGIFLEALFFEFSIAILGLNFPAFLVGGGISLLSALIHKLMNLLILYGKDFITIYDNLISFAFRQFSSAGISIEHMLVGLAFLYMISGMLAALLGFLAGRRVAASPVPSVTITAPESILYESEPAPANRSVPLLVLHLTMIPFLLYLNYAVRWHISLIIIAAYIIILVLIYPGVFRRLSKPMLWLQLAFMLLLSILFLSTYKAGSGFNKEGLISGLRMNIRALLVVTGFAAIGSELRNEKIKSFFLLYANPRIYQSLRISFNLLPSFMQQMNSPGKLLLHPVSSLKQMLTNAEYLLNHLNKGKMKYVN
jgi:hypothetical protein